MENNPIIVSIIVPIYKIKEEYLEQCIESLVHQTYQNLDIILIDDGSPDQCGEICDDYAKQYESIHVIHQKNEGVAVARNVGMENAKGEYITFVDADDWLEPDCIEKVLNEIMLRKVDVLYFQRCEEGLRPRTFPKTGSRYIEKEDLLTIQKKVLGKFFKDFTFAPSTPWGKIIKTDFLKSNKLIFPVHLARCQDVIFNLYLLEFLERAYFLDYTGYHYRRLHNNSYNLQYHPEIPKVILHFMKETDKFIAAYHKDAVEYHGWLGAGAVNSLRRIESNYTFHPQSQLSRREIIRITKNFLNEDIVKKYTDKCSVRYFDKPGRILRYLLLKFHLYNLYYFACKYGKPILKNL